MISTDSRAKCERNRCGSWIYLGAWGRSVWDWKREVTVWRLRMLWRSVQVLQKHSSAFSRFRNGLVRVWMIMLGLLNLGRTTNEPKLLISARIPCCDMLSRNMQDTRSNAQPNFGIPREELQYLIYLRLEVLIWSLLGSLGTVSPGSW